MTGLLEANREDAILAARAVDPHSIGAGANGVEAAVDFRDGLRDLCAPALMRRRRELTVELGAGEAQRFRRSFSFGIRRGRAVALRTLTFDLVPAFLNSGL